MDVKLCPWDGVEVVTNLYKYEGIEGRIREL
jgi:hypothetical protein